MGSRVFVKKIIQIFMRLTSVMLTVIIFVPYAMMRNETRIESLCIEADLYAGR